jgi:hypothetical protein
MGYLTEIAKTAKKERSKIVRSIPVFLSIVGVLWFCAMVLFNRKKVIIILAIAGVLLSAILFCIALFPREPCYDYDEKIERLRKQGEKGLEELFRMAVYPEEESLSVMFAAGAIGVVGTPLAAQYSLRVIMECRTGSAVSGAIAGLGYCTNVDLAETYMLFSGFSNAQFLKRYLKMSADDRKASSQGWFLLDNWGSRSGNWETDYLILVEKRFFQEHLWRNISNERTLEGEVWWAKPIPIMPPLIDYEFWKTETRYLAEWPRYKRQIVLWWLQVRQLPNYPKQQVLLPVWSEAQILREFVNEIEKDSELAENNRGLLQRTLKDVEELEKKKN